MVQPEVKKFILGDELRIMLIQYLGQKPMAEVEGMVNALRSLGEINTVLTKEEAEKLGAKAVEEKPKEKK